jgi:hypothetical protein
MKTHYTIIISLAVVLIIIGTLVWANPTQAPDGLTIEPAYEEQTSTLLGSWRGEGQYDDESVWYMLYTFSDDNTFTLETDSTYEEDGTFRIVKEYNDGSVDVSKTYMDGERTHEMHVAFVDENTINIEGAQLLRIIVD